MSDNRTRSFATRISLFLALTSIISCCTPKPDTDEVYSWGKANYTVAFSQTGIVAPKFADLAKVPDDFDFSKATDKIAGPNDLNEIDTANAEFLRDVGVVSALADFCGLPWKQRNFLPMMQWQRARLPRHERRGYLIAIIGFSHEYAMGRTDDLLKSWQPDCEVLARELDGRLFADMFPQYEP